MLVQEMVRFATKMLMIANHQIIIQDKKEDGQTVEATLSTLGQKKLNRNSLLLQSIGNSILSQANELIARKDFEDKDQEASSSEWQAAKLTLKNTENVSVPKARTEVMDRIISELRYQEINVLKLGAQCGDPEALAQLQETGAQSETGASPPTTSGLDASQSAARPTAPKDDENAPPPPAAAPTSPIQETPLLEPNAAGEGVATATATSKSPADASTTPAATTPPTEPGDPSAASKAKLTDSSLTAEQTKACLNIAQDKVKMIRNAIKVAYEHRSGMIFIRPPAAYLRQVFSATGLQDDPNLGWQNTLRKHASRSIFGDVKGKLAPDRIETLSEIDKQFWQNINSIRVAGAGNTDYVLVKDDIGNWYVKSFAADPKEIFQAAQSTALFALGGSINTNLLLLRNAKQDILNADDAEKQAAQDRYTSLRAALTTDGDGVTSGQAGSAKKVLTYSKDRFESALDAQTSSLLEAIAENSITEGIRAAALSSLEGISEASRQKFQTDLDKILTLIEPKIDETEAALKTTKEPPEDSTETGLQPYERKMGGILSALDGLKSARASLKKELSSVSVVSDDSSLAEAQTKLETLNTKFDEARTNLERIDIKIELLDTQIKEIEDAGDPVPTKIQTALDQARSDQTASKTKKDAAEAAVAAQESLVSSKQEISNRDVAATQRARAAAEGYLDRLITAQRTELSNSLADLQATLSVLSPMMIAPQ
jgi:hypothetical protein